MTKLGWLKPVDVFVASVQSVVALTSRTDHTASSLFSFVFVVSEKMNNSNNNNNNNNNN